MMRAASSVWINSTAVSVLISPRDQRCSTRMVKKLTPDFFIKVLSGARACSEIMPFNYAERVPARLTALAAATLGPGTPRTSTNFSRADGTRTLRRIRISAYGERCGYRRLWIHYHIRYTIIGATSTRDSIHEQGLFGWPRFGGLLLVGTQTHAHHAVASVYDLNKEVVLEGQLTKLNFVNPHPNMLVAVRTPMALSRSGRSRPLRSRT